MKEISIKELTFNPYTLFADQWAALCCGDEKEYGAMTIAWGQIGSLFERGTHSNRIPVATVYVRESRNTRKLMDNRSTFSICFLPENKKKALGWLGSHHGGRGIDKIKLAGLTPSFLDGTVYVEEAEMVLICRKLYEHDIIADKITDKDLISFNYPNGDYHRAYIGEIMHVLSH